MTSAPVELTAGDAGRREAYLNEVLPLLYPDPCTRSAPGSSPGYTADLPVHREFVVLPDVARARLLAPAGKTRVTVGAVRRYSEPQSLTSRLKRRAVIAAFRSGTDGLLLRDRVRIVAPDGADHIERFLGELLGHRFDLSVHIGPARANRKPVLQLLDAQGRTVAFVKLGTNDLTRELVRAEARALTALASSGLRHLRTPTVLATGQWHGHEVLAAAALPVEQARVPMDPRRLTDAMKEVAGMAGLQRQPLSDSRYWAGLRTRIAALTETDDGRALAAAAHELVDHTGAQRLDFGCWHGDWTPWNMATVTDGLLVWDWERFTDDVPLGFDPLHHLLQSSIVRDGHDPRHAVARCLTRAPSVLSPFGVTAEIAGTTALLYLVELATRYLTDRQAEAGARLGVLGTWLLPELVAAVSRLTDQLAPAGSGSAAATQPAE